MGIDNKNSRLELRRVLAKRSGTQPQDWFLVFKARYGMKVVFDVLRSHFGDGSVATQLFTCCTAVDPIVSAGLRPVYLDIDPDVLSFGAEPLNGIADLRCAVIQHTFGITSVPHDEQVCQAAHAKGALVMEDNAHCVGQITRDASGNPIADVSIHSFGVEKILPGSYFGGAVWVNPELDASVRGELVAALEGLPELSEKLDRATRRYHNQIRVISRLPHGLAVATSARLTKSGAFEPAVSEDERRGLLPHPAQQPSDWVAEQAIAQLAGLGDNLARRVERTQQYNAAFQGAKGFQVPNVVLDTVPASPLLRYPVVLATSEQAGKLVARISQLGFYAVRWYKPLLVPGVLDSKAFSYDETSLDWPETNRISDGIVCLPTDLTAEQTAQIVMAVMGTADAADSTVKGER